MSLSLPQLSAYGEKEHGPGIKYLITMIYESVSDVKGINSRYTLVHCRHV
jgi:hypothetical protein